VCGKNQWKGKDKHEGNAGHWTDAKSSPSLVPTLLRAVTVSTPGNPSAIHGGYIIVNSVTRDNLNNTYGDIARAGSRPHSSGVISIFIHSQPLIPIPFSTNTKEK
jgi:hypothetical protein